MASATRIFGVGLLVMRKQASTTRDARSPPHGDPPSIHPGRGLCHGRTPNPTASGKTDYLKIVVARHMYSSQQYHSRSGGGGDVYSGSTATTILPPVTNPTQALKIAACLHSKAAHLYGIQTCKSGRQEKAKKARRSPPTSTGASGSISTGTRSTRKPAKSWPGPRRPDLVPASRARFSCPRIVIGSGRRSTSSRRTRRPPLVRLLLQRNGDQQAAIRSASANNHDPAGNRHTGTSNTGGYKQRFRCSMTKSMVGGKHPDGTPEKDHEGHGQESPTWTIGRLFAPANGSPVSLRHTARPS